MNWLASHNTTAGIPRRQSRLAAVVLASLLLPAAMAACGEDDEARINRERQEAADSARQGERIRQLERDVRRRDRPRGQRSASPPAPVPPTEEVGGNFLGTWKGTLAQRAPSGAQDSVEAELDLFRASPGRTVGGLTENINGDACGGSVVLTGAKGASWDLIYTERQDAGDCIRATTITITRVSANSLTFEESYSTTKGRGGVTGSLRKTSDTADVCNGDPNPRC